MARKEMTKKELAWEAWKASALLWVGRHDEELSEEEFNRWWDSFNKTKK